MARESNCNAPQAQKSSNSFTWCFVLRADGGVAPRGDCRGHRSGPRHAASLVMGVSARIALLSLIGHRKFEWRRTRRQKAGVFANTFSSVVPAHAGTQFSAVLQFHCDAWVTGCPAFRLRAPRFGGLEPAVARKASVGWVAGHDKRGRGALGKIMPVCAPEDCALQKCNDASANASLGVRLSGLSFFTNQPTHGPKRSLSQSLILAPVRDSGMHVANASARLEFENATDEKSSP